MTNLPRLQADDMSVCIGHAIRTAHVHGRLPPIVREGVAFSSTMRCSPGNNPNHSDERARI